MHVTLTFLQLSTLAAGFACEEARCKRLLCYVQLSCRHQRSGRRATIRLQNDT